MNEIWSVEISQYSPANQVVKTFWLYGPVIEIGSSVAPSPNSIQIPSILGVAALHTRIKLYEDAKAYIQPLGIPPVRVAPHLHVNWNHISPLQNEILLNVGDIVHLGPLNKGYRLRINRIEPHQWHKDKHLRVNNIPTPHTVPQKKSDGYLPPLEIIVLMVVLLIALILIVTNYA